MHSAVRGERPPAFSAGGPLPGVLEGDDNELMDTGSFRQGARVAPNNEMHDADDESEVDSSFSEHVVFDMPDGCACDFSCSNCFLLAHGAVGCTVVDAISSICRSVLPPTAPRFVPRLSQRRSFFGQFQTEPVEEDRATGMRESFLGGFKKTSEVFSGAYGKLAGFSQRRKTCPDTSWVRPEALQGDSDVAASAAPPASILGGPGSLSRGRHMTVPCGPVSKRWDQSPQEPPPPRQTGTSTASSKWEIVRNLVTAQVVPEADAAMAVRDANGNGLPRILLNWRVR